MARSMNHHQPGTGDGYGGRPGDRQRDDGAEFTTHGPEMMATTLVALALGYGRLRADDPSLRVGVPVDQLLCRPRDEGGHVTGSPILAPWRHRVDAVAPVVLVIGGFMSSPPMYRSLRRLLLERGAPEVVIARLWMPDWMLAVGRGQGAIAARAGRALLDAFAASAASEASAGAPVLAVGHSGGGVIARILTSREPFERRRMNASGRIGAIVTLGSPQMFDAKGPSAQRMGATALWANRHVPGAFAAPRTGYLCVGSDAIVGSSSGNRKARRIDRYYRGVISAPEGASIPGDGITPLAAAFLPGVESIVLHDAGHANVISRHWYGDADHVDAWWPRAVEVWRDALRARVRAGDAAAASDNAAGESPG